MIGRDIMILKKQTKGKQDGTHDFIGVDFRKNKFTVYAATKMSNEEKIATLIYPKIIEKLNEA